MVAGMLCGGRQSCNGPRKKKKFQPFDNCVVGTMICGHHLSLLFLFLEWPAYSVFSGKFRQSTSQTLTKIRRQLSFTFLQFFDLFFVSLACFACLRPVLFISDQFLHFPASPRQSFFFLSF